jgi:hypothetical protein
MSPKREYDPDSDSRSERVRQQNAKRSKKYRDRNAVGIKERGREAQPDVYKERDKKGNDRRRLRDDVETVEVAINDASIEANEARAFLKVRI